MTTSQFITNAFQEQKWFPSESARGGPIILLKENIKHFQQVEIRGENEQTTVVTIKNNDD